MSALGIAIPKTLAKWGLRGPSRLVGKCMESTDGCRRVLIRYKALSPWFDLKDDFDVVTWTKESFLFKEMIRWLRSRNVFIFKEVVW